VPKAAVPPCRSLGRQCHELRLILRVADLKADSPHERDALGTWLLGHQERLTFGRRYAFEGSLVVDARLHVRCRHLQDDGRADGRAVRCRAHGFAGHLPRPSRPRPAPVRHGERRFTLMQDGALLPVDLVQPEQPRRALPVLAGSNPCATAPCRTADNQRGAACCRDLILDVVLPLGDEELEALLRSRKSPYVCKIERTDEVTVECEVISACHYLEHDGIHCGLHGLRRPDGRQAKPELCFEFPDIDDEELVGHPGCVFLADRG
jgi:hypothetical protein